MINFVNSASSPRSPEVKRLCQVLSTETSLTVKDPWDVAVEMDEKWQSVEAVLLLDAGHVDGHHLHVLLVKRLVQLVHCIQDSLVHPRENAFRLVLSSLMFQYILTVHINIYLTCCPP